MAYTPDFSTSQTLGSTSKINFVDTSSGVDAAITSRRVYMQTAAGTYLVQKNTATTYEIWALGSSTITLDILDKDYALLITVQWVDVNAAVLYSKQYTLGFTLFNETFDYSLTQQLSGNPLLVNDSNFFPNKSDLRDFIDAGNQAVTFASDSFSAQQCYDRATNLRLSSQYFFNINI